SAEGAQDAILPHATGPGSPDGTPPDEASARSEADAKRRRPRRRPEAGGGGEDARGGGKAGDPPGPEQKGDFLSVLSQFPKRDLAMRLFGTIENARVDFLLRSTYRGIRRDLDFVQGRLVEHRPRIDALPAEMVPFELLFQVALCGGAALDARRGYPAFVSRLEDIIENYVRSKDATVADSLTATARVYKMLVDLHTESEDQNSDAESEGDEGEGSDNSTTPDPAGDRSQQSRQQMEAREDPF